MYNLGNVLRSLRGFRFYSLSHYDFNTFYDCWLAGISVYYRTHSIPFKQVQIPVKRVAQTLCTHTDIIHWRIDSVIMGGDRNLAEAPANANPIASRDLWLVLASQGNNVLPHYGLFSTFTNHSGFRIF